MKQLIARLCLMALTGLLVVSALLAATTPPPGTISGFKMLLASHETKGKSVPKTILMGLTGQPRAGGFLIKGVKLEMYAESGQREMLVEAEDCIYDQQTKNASSSGKLKAQTEDGAFFIEGEGFEWRQAESRLVISNKVHTIIRQ
jgi:hypothetical protein